jgi:hypothetical protein
MKLRRIVLFAATVLVVVGSAIGIVIATGSSDDETPITSSALEQASAAALNYTGGGTVTDSEVGDEEGYYEIEVTMADGTEIDVHLDKDFSVIGSETETDEADDREN